MSFGGSCERIYFISLCGEIAKYHNGEAVISHFAVRQNISLITKGVVAMSDSKLRVRFSIPPAARTNGWPDLSEARLTDIGKYLKNRGKEEDRR